MVREFGRPAGLVALGFCLLFHFKDALRAYTELVYARSAESLVSLGCAYDSAIRAEDRAASTKARQFPEEKTSMGPDEPTLLSRTARWLEAALTSTQLFAWTVLYDDRRQCEKPDIIPLKSARCGSTNGVAQSSTRPRKPVQRWGTRCSSIARVSCGSRDAPLKRRHRSEYVYTDSRSSR
jgi:hypothetical protein